MSSAKRPKNETLPVIVDYPDVMPGIKPKRLSAEERENLRAISKKLATVAKAHGTEFKIIKGDKS
jgi:hypothetical protein